MQDRPGTSHTTAMIVMPDGGPTASLHRRG
jgi:hypothetical protein